MANINLSTEINESGPSNVIGGSTMKFMILLIIVLLIWGGLIAGKFYLDNKIKEAESQYQTAYAQFISGNAGNISDFQNRSDIARGLLKNNFQMNLYLGEIEKSIVPGVYLDSLKYDNVKKELAINCLASNYNDVAKQIFSFKQDASFVGVIPGDSGLIAGGSNDKTPQISFPITLKLK